MVVVQDYVTRRKGVEVLRYQIINCLVTEVREEYCAKLYTLQVHAIQEAVHSGGRRIYQEY